MVRATGKILHVSQACKRRPASSPPQTRRPGHEQANFVSDRRLTAELAGRPLDSGLDHWLNAHPRPGSATFERCARPASGVAEGWLCEREGGGIKYGRVFKAEDALHRFSVDVVDMQDIAGPHHAHPNGEIDLIMPLDEAGATFDGRPAGWCVYPPGSAHHPTVARAAPSCSTCCPRGRSNSPRLTWTDTP
jgi:hypothetical protein